MANDNGLISRAQAGDEEAFAELMRAYYAYVYTIVIGIVGNPNDAEEIVQDTFLSAYCRLTQLQDTEKFKSWLAEIARNQARDRLRKQKVNTVSIDKVSAHTLQTPDAVDDQLIRNEQRELIRRAIETLSEQDREIVRSYYLEGASYDELIQTHGLSYKAISVRLSRAKQKLARRLKRMLTAIFLLPATTLKQIYSGGLIAMKIGTAPKITVGAIGIIVLLSVGIHQLILPKFFGTKHTASSVQTEAPSGLAEMEVNQQTEDSKNQRQFSDKEMEQINNFFAQFDATDAQSDTAQHPIESKTGPAATHTDVVSKESDEALEQQRLARLKELQQAWDEGWQKVEANIAESNELVDEYERLLQRYVELIDEQNRLEDVGMESESEKIQIEINTVREKKEQVRQMMISQGPILQEEREEIGKQLKAIKDEIRSLGGELRK